MFHSFQSVLKIAANIKLNEANIDIYFSQSGLSIGLLSTIQYSLYYIFPLASKLQINDKMSYCALLTRTQ